MLKCKLCGNSDTFKRRMDGKVSYYVDYHPVTDTYVASSTPVIEEQIKSSKNVCPCGSESIEYIPPKRLGNLYDLYVESNLYGLCD